MKKGIAAKPLMRLAQYRATHSRVPRHAAARDLRIVPLCGNDMDADLRDGIAWRSTRPGEFPKRDRCLCAGAAQWCRSNGSRTCRASACCEFGRPARTRTRPPFAGLTRDAQVLGSPLCRIVLRRPDRTDPGSVDNCGP